jgi:hypothetical protein
MPRGRATQVQAPPLHGLPGQSWNCQRRIGSKPMGSTPATSSPTFAGRSGSTSENTAREGEPAEERHLASDRTSCTRACANQSFCMAPPIGCSGPSRASCRSARPVRHPAQQADQARHRGHRNGRSHSDRPGPGVPDRGYPHPRLDAPRPVRHLSAGPCARTQEPVPATPNPPPHPAIETRPRENWKT